MTSLPRKMSDLCGTARCAAGVYLLLWLITPRLPALDLTCTTNHGAITITGYTGPDKALILPGRINGLPVTSIGQGVFAYCTNLTNIKIPNTITNIGRGAFEGYPGLIEVYKPAMLGSHLGAEYGTNLWTERVTLPLDKIKLVSSQVLIEQCINTPGPWPAGNSLAVLADPVDLEARRPGMADAVWWTVFNMHAENFYEITRRLGLTSVEAEVVHRRLTRQRRIYGPETPEIVQMVDEGDCIITDARIPKEWLRSIPDTYRLKGDWRQYLETYPDKFNVPEKK